MTSSVDISNNNSVTIKIISCQTNVKDEGFLLQNNDMTCRTILLSQSDGLSNVRAINMVHYELLL